MVTAVSLVMFMAKALENRSAEGAPRKAAIVGDLGHSSVAAVGSPAARPQARHSRAHSSRLRAQRARAEVLSHSRPTLRASAGGGAAPAPRKGEGGGGEEGGNPGVAGDLKKKKKKKR